MSVWHNTSRPESVLRKKSNSVCYHAVHESVAVGESLFGLIPSNENVADLMTKVLYGQMRRYLVRNILCDTHDDHYLSVSVSTECNQASLITLLIVSNLRGLKDAVVV